jgi:UDP-glucose 4-epimerase
MISPAPAHKVVLITGASGFIGRALARHFTKQQYKVYGIDRIPSENAPLADLQRYEQIELPNPCLIQLLVDWRPDVLIHCAGRASVPAAMQDPYADYIDGPILTFELLEALRKNLPECAFLLLSSAAVYGNPLSLPVREDDSPAPISTYGFHKWQSELLCQEFSLVYNIRTVSARVFSAYGTGLRRQVVWDIVHKALLQKEILLQGTGHESRDFIHAQDIALAIEKILAHAPMRGENYNVASGKQTTILDLSAMILDFLDLDLPIRASGIAQPGAPLNWQADVSRLLALGYTPKISLEEGIRSFVVWCQQELK